MVDVPEDDFLSISDTDSIDEMDAELNAAIQAELGPMECTETALGGDDDTEDQLYATALASRRGNRDSVDHVLQEELHCDVVDAGEEPRSGAVVGAAEDDAKCKVGSPRRRKPSWERRSESPRQRKSRRLDASQLAKHTPPTSGSPSTCSTSGSCRVLSSDDTPAFRSKQFSGRTRRPLARRHFGHDTPSSGNRSAGCVDSPDTTRQRSRPSQGSARLQRRPRSGSREGRRDRTRLDRQRSRERVYDRRRGLSKGPSMPATFVVSLKHDRAEWEKNRERMRRPVWRDFDSASVHAESAHTTSWIRKVSGDSFPRELEKAAAAFGGFDRVATPELERDNRAYLMRVVTDAVDDDDCDDVKRDRQLAFPTLGDGTLNELARMGWSEFTQKAPSLKARWSVCPSLLRLTRVTRCNFISNARLHELFEAADELLTWMLWHELEEERIHPHDPIFSNIYVLCMAIHNRMGIVLSCYLSSVGSTLMDPARNDELPMDSAKCPLTFLLTFMDRFSRVMHRHPGISIMSYKGVDPTRAVSDSYIPGTCARKIPLVLAQHANVCRKEDCRVICAQLVGRQYSVGRIFRCDMFH